MYPARICDPAVVREHAEGLDRGQELPAHGLQLDLETKELSPEEVKELWPLAYTDDVLAGFYSPGDEVVLQSHRNSLERSGVTTAGKGLICRVCRRPRSIMIDRQIGMELRFRLCSPIENVVRQFPR